MKENGKVIALLTCCLMLAALLASLSFYMADGHADGKHLRKYYDKHADKALRGLGTRGRDKGNETTGQIAAWGLALANLAVGISILAKAIRRFAPLSPEIKNSIGKFNNFQKKYLMVLHYFLNPLILAIALLHWTLSRCKATALPEWGLLTMLAAVGLGIVLKFKLCPKTLLRNVYKMHTQPVMLLIFVSLLVIGHFAMD